jgi:hypothetical protein
VDVRWRTATREELIAELERLQRENERLRREHERADRDRDRYRRDRASGSTGWKTIGTAPSASCIGKRRRFPAARRSAPRDDPAVNPAPPTGSTRTDRRRVR